MATLHTFTFSTATLDAGSAITGLGAGETVRGLALESSTEAWLHTGSRSSTRWIPATAVATAVGAAITDDDEMIVGLTFLAGTLYGLQADGKYVSLDTTTAAATETGDEFGDDVAAVGGFALTSNEDDTRVVVLGVDGRLHFYDPVMSAASLTYAVYLGGVRARTIQALVQASEDPTDDDVSAVILPRPSGVNARVRVL